VLNLQEDKHFRLFQILRTNREIETFIELGESAAGAYARFAIGRRAHSRVANLSEHAGLYALTLQSLDDASTAFLSFLFLPFAYVGTRAHAARSK
jgi:hypothetical protein